MGGVGRRGGDVGGGRRGMGGRHERLENRKNNSARFSIELVSTIAGND